jgi:hypothetical protein
VATAGVDFFRVDRSGATKRVLTVAGVLVAVGATSVGAHLVSRFGPAFGRLVSLLGGMMVIAGLILGFGAMAMLLFENVYLLIREDGVLCHDNGKETTIAWGDLERVTLDVTTGFVVFQCKGAPSLRWFAGKNAKQVQACVESAKRKALLGLLRA